MDQAPENKRLNGQGDIEELKDQRAMKRSPAEIKPFDLTSIHLRKAYT